VNTEGVNNPCSLLFMVCGGIAGIFVAGENCVIIYMKCLQMMGVKKISR